MITQQERLSLAVMNFVNVRAWFLQYRKSRCSGEALVYIRRGMEENDGRRPRYHGTAGKEGVVRPVLLQLRRAAGRMVWRDHQIVFTQESN